MAITYSCIANGRAVLAELALTGGSYQEAAAIVLRLVLLRAEPKTIIRMGSFVYHTLCIGGITYLCATDNAMDIITPPAFLKNVSDTFLRNSLMSQEYFSPSNTVAADFQQVLGKYMGITATLEYGTILAYLDSSLLLFYKFQNHWAPMSNFLKDHRQGSPEMQKKKQGIPAGARANPCTYRH
ncbi:Vesicle-Associated Membrane Protein 7 [Manis pentadactyla]|nr:Vesicle-Associated Membrane Protein 7 [Manis pentadactyla]